MLRQKPRVPLPLFCALCSLIALSAVSHKEERFIYPVIVLVSFAAAPGVIEAIRLAAAKLRPWLAAGALMTNAVGFFFPGELRALRGDQFRAITRASQLPGTSGLLIVNEGLWGAGGFFYIGKRVPWLTCDWPSDYSFRVAMADARFNRVVTYDGRALFELEHNGFRIEARVDEATILTRP
jgi:hypothetical protein